MSSRRRSGQPRSPLGNRSAKAASPRAVPSAVPPDPTPIEPAAAAQVGPSVANALLSSVSIDAVDAGQGPSLAPPSGLAERPASSAASADIAAIAPDPAPVAAPPAMEVSGSEARTDGPAATEIEAIEAGDIAAGNATAGADAIVVPMPPAREPAPPHPTGFAAPSVAPLGEINATLSAFVRGEGAAAIAHLGALSRAGSPAEAIRLQVGEFQRAADASLSCFSAIVRSAHRLADAARTP